MKEVEFKDIDGRLYRRLIPDDTSPFDLGAIDRGLDLGPPYNATRKLVGVPEEVAVRLHNNLYWRGLYTVGDVKNRRSDVVSALMATLAVDADRIVQTYLDEQAAIVDISNIVAPVVAETTGRQRQRVQSRGRVDRSQFLKQSTSLDGDGDKEGDNKE